MTASTMAKADLRELIKRYNPSFFDELDYVVKHAKGIWEIINMDNKRKMEKIYIVRLDNEDRDTIYSMLGDYAVVWIEYKKDYDPAIRAIYPVEAKIYGYRTDVIGLPYILDEVYHMLDLSTVQELDAADRLLKAIKEYEEAEDKAIKEYMETNNIEKFRQFCENIDDRILNKYFKKVDSIEI